MIKLKENTKKVVRFVNAVDINKLVEFLDTNNISYDPDLTDGKPNRFVSFGTSKKYTVGTSQSFDIYIKKGFTSFNYVDSMFDSSAVHNLLDEIFESIAVANVVLDEVSLDSEVPSEIIRALYTKVKKQKKSPANYFVVSDGNDSYKATTCSSIVSFGNLKELFESISE